MNTAMDLDKATLRGQGLKEWQWLEKVSSVTWMEILVFENEGCRLGRERVNSAFGRLIGMIWWIRMHLLPRPVVAVFVMNTEWRGVFAAVAAAAVVVVPLRDSVLMSWDKIVYRVSQATRINH